MSFGVLCSGQGGQHAAMFDLLLHEDGEGAIAAAGDAAGMDLLRTVAAEPPTMFVNAIAQPLIVAWQGVVWALLAPRLVAAEIAVACVAGYSIGELAGHACAGRFDWGDAIALARERARWMDRAAGPDGGLVAVRGLRRDALDALPSMRGIEVAIVNDVDQFVLGGPVRALDELTVDVLARGATARPLPVGLAAHTSWLAAAVEPFRRALEATAWRPSTTPVLSGLDGSIVRDRSTTIDVLARQVATTIRWSDCMDALRERGVRRCLELGPGNALARMMRDRHPDIDTRAVADFRSLDAIVGWAGREDA